MDEQEHTETEFTEFLKSNIETNSPWQHFLRSTDGVRAKCKICTKILKNSRSTTPLYTHLKRIHSINLQKRTQQNASASSSNTSVSAIDSTSQMASIDEGTEVTEPPKKKTKTTDCYLKSDDRMEVHVAKLAALDGLSFHVICTSTTLRKLFAKSGYNLPKSPHTIKQIVVTHSEQIKLALKEELTRMKSDDCSYSVSLDEWTSVQNIRYMNINIRSPKLKPNGFKNLGLVRIKNKGTAENLHTMLEEKLTDFDLTMSDVICIVSDGASVMCALGRRTAAVHQLCYAHGIQLAVLDIVYKKKTASIPIAESSYSDSEIENDYDPEGEMEVEDEEGMDITLTGPSAMELAGAYKELINKVRSVVKLFKKSPTKSDLLYNNAEDDKKNVRLILDCKTRWSSLADMITRFLLLKQTVLKSLIDLKSNIKFSEEDLQQLEEIAESLNVIKTAVEALCQQDANLFTAEIAMKFMINKLSLQRSQLSMNLVDALKERIAQRRLPEVIGTLKYLHNPTNFYREGRSEYPFENPSNDRVREIIMKLSSPIEHVHVDEPIHSRILDRDNRFDSSSDSISMKDQLQNEIKKGLSAGYTFNDTQESSRDLDIETQINVEMALFDSGGKRTANLERAYNSLLTIPPTSVEAERVFSAAGYLCNHLRSRMKQDSLDALSFLRSHFQAGDAK